MKEKFRNSIRHTVAFVSAITVMTSAVLVTSFAEEEKASEPVSASAVTTLSEIQETTTSTVTKTDTSDSSDGKAKGKIYDYTKLFPGLTSPKLKLSDPKFTEKDWYEYVEYEFYTEVKDGDITYRIYQPTDYKDASIMAITDYNPKEVLGGTSKLIMNLGELQGILDIAAQGGNISKQYAGLNLATGIASQMNSINDVMDNSKYYSKSSFLGIPGDKKYKGVSNDGFFNADSLEIEISESETVSAGKTVAVSSDYSTSESNVSSKDFTTFSEASEAKSNTHEENESREHTKSAGKSITKSKSETEEDSESTVESVSDEITDSIIGKVSASVSSSTGIEAGGKVDGALDIKAVKSYTVGVEAGLETGRVTGHTTSQSKETGHTHASTNEKSDTTSEELSDTEGNAISDSETFENTVTNGSNSSSGQQHAKDMAVGIGYGVDYQYGNDHSLSVGVSRTFNARDDKEVKNVGWKLCEYVVKVPYYVEAVKTDSTGEEKVLYGQYVNYNLLNGVSRVFANGYIEHWYTGELVTYADFFEGFITATELIDMAQEQQKAKLPKEAR